MARLHLDSNNGDGINETKGFISALVYIWMISKYSKEGKTSAAYNAEFYKEMEDKMPTTTPVNYWAKPRRQAARPPVGLSNRSRLG